MATEIKNNTMFDGEIAIATLSYKDDHGVLTPIIDNGWKQHFTRGMEEELLKRYTACSMCKGCREDRYGGQEGKLVKEKHICFYCAFWLNRLEENKALGDRVVIFEGRHYIAHQPNPRGMQGYGGARWKITGFDGTERICTNLWQQGEIPAHFLAQFPDTVAKLEAA